MPDEKNDEAELVSIDLSKLLGFKTLAVAREDIELGEIMDDVFNKVGVGETL